MYRIKLYKHNVKVSIDDDIPKVIEYISRKLGITCSFDVEETTVAYQEFPYKLLTPLDGKYDAVMYLFDRYEQNIYNSLAWKISDKTCGIYISTSIYDDPVGGTWMTMVHELFHTFFYRIKNTVQVFDNMDGQYVNGVWTPYYKNWDPEALDGNFATAITTIKPYISKIDPSIVATSPVDSTLPIVTITRTYTDKETFGDLTATLRDATFTCKTLELPNLGNQHNISCIPEGTYTARMSFWAKKLKSTYLLDNVPNRNGIRIHVGNFAGGVKKDSEGCILLGKTFVDLNGDNILDIASSTVTLKAFEQFLDKKPFQLVIK